MAKPSFANKKILMTGATSDVGWYVATELIRQGAKLAACGESSERLLRLNKSLGNPEARLGRFVGNVADAEFRHAMIPAATEWLGGIDILLVIPNQLDFYQRFPHAIGGLEQIMADELFSIADLVETVTPQLRRGKRPVACFAHDPQRIRGTGGSACSHSAHLAFIGWLQGLQLELQSKNIQVRSIVPRQRTVACPPDRLCNQRLSQAAAAQIVGTLRHGRGEGILNSLQQLKELLKYLSFKQWWPYARSAGQV